MRREKIFDQLMNIAKAYREYPLTMILFILLALMNSWEIANDFAQYDRFLLTLLTAISLSLLVGSLERILFEGRFKQLPLTLLTIPLSILYYFYLPPINSSYLIAGIRTGLIVFTLFIAFIWLPSLKNKERYFYEYFLASFKAVFISIFYSIVLFLGVQAIISAIDYLIFDVDYEYFLHSANIIGFIIAPSYFLSLMAEIHRAKDRKKNAVRFEISSLLKTLLNYILIPLISIYSLVLLTYILLNLGGELWKDNLLEPMLISYIVMVLLLYLLASNLSGKLSSFFRKVFPKLLIGIVLFQLTASFLKINELGLTLGRYYVISFGIFALVAGIIFSFRPKEESGLIIPVFLFLSFLSLVPGIDAFSLAEKSQKNLLFETLDKNEMLQQNQILAKAALRRQDQEKITSSLEYLADYGYLEDLSYLPDDFSPYEDFEETFGFSRIYETTAENTSFYYASLDQKDMEVLRIKEEDYLLNLYIDNYKGNEETQNIKLNADYSVRLFTQETYPKIVLVHKDESVLEMNLKELYQKVFSEDSEESMRTEEEMTLIQENENYRMRLLANDLTENKEEESRSGQIYLFIKIKE